MDLSIFCVPTSNPENIQNLGEIGKDVLCLSGEISPADLELFDVAIVRMPSSHSASLSGLNNIAEELFGLNQGNRKFRIADFGAILPGQHTSDSLFAIRGVAKFLIENHKMLLVLGDEQWSTLGIYQAYADLEKSVNLACVDYTADLGAYEDPLSSSSYIGKIVLDQPNYLFNLSILGYQTPFVAQKDLQLLHKLYFDAIRLGQLRKDFREVEPLLRAADIVSLDLNALKSGDFGFAKKNLPNGFTSEEVCQLARYAGLSERLSTFAMFHYNSIADKQSQGANLLAQVLWYLLDGFYNRIIDHPDPSNKSYLKYIIANEHAEEDLVFLKSLKTDKWWMSIKMQGSDVIKWRRNQLIPCSYEDYQLACKNEIPERWWKATSKLL